MISSKSIHPKVEKHKTMLLTLNPNMTMIILADRKFKEDQVRGNKCLTRSSKLDQWGMAPQPNKDSIEQQLEWESITIVGTITVGIIEWICLEVLKKTSREL